MSANAQAQRAQVLTGRVLGDSAKPLAGAVVSVTMAPARTFKQDTTGADGRWRMQFDAPSGDYLVHIASLGRNAFRKRVTAPVADSLIVVDATLASSVQQLAAVNVKATQPKPSREGDTMLPDGVSTEQVTSGVNGAVAADMAGDLAAMAGTIPGLALAPGGGVTAFGLDASQSSTTLNGLSFPGASLPRNAATSTRFTTSTYDPARGGFAGVETAVTLSQGNIYTRRTSNVTLDAPQLQAADRTSRLLGQRVTGGIGSIGGSGAWVEDEWFYNASLDIARRVSDAPSLLGADASLFPLAGVAPDSVSRLLGSLSTLRIPASISGAASERVTDKMSFALRVDHAPYLPQSFTANPKTWAVVALGNVNRSQAQGISLTSTPARGGTMTNGYGLVQGIFSAYVAGYSLSETRTGLFVSRQQGTPYLRLPNGNVLVSSQLPDGSSGASALAFGGNASLESEDTQWNWDTRTDYLWYARPLHRVKVTAGSKVDGYQSHASGNALGSYSYASLADLSANRPSSFTRTLGEPTRDGAAWNGFASIGDQWRATPTLQLVYGARIETNRYLTAPSYNSALDNTLGVRNDASPAHVHVSPRMGFSWRFGGERGGYSGFGFSGLGSKILQPSGLLRGGIGEFRSTLSPQLLGAPSVFTGLPGASRRVSCVGQAVPVPDWSLFASDAATIPSACVGSSPLVDAAPQVQLVDASFDAARSWRASLGLMTVVKHVSVSVDGNLSLNLNQPSVYDVNFAGVPRFTLADEGRPVFVSAAGIDAASGVLSAVDSRRASAYGSVLSRRSDLSSVSRQVTVAVSPQSNWGWYMLNVAYTLGSVRGDKRGYDGASFGDPRVTEDARGDLDTRHRWQVQVAKSFPRGFNFSMNVVAASGLPYTPVVSGDVNGDGIGRDRAYVFDPSHTSDAALAAGMRGLLAAAPSRARDCLLSQLGRAAGMNSCEGPWTANATARVAIANSQGPWGRRVNAALSITNPLGGLDQALHAERGLQGWGTTVSPDAVLLIVRGFDAQANRFRYDVNPRFGSTSLAQTTVRVPFRVTLDVSIDIGPATAQQQLERVLNRGRAGHPGGRLTADSIRARFSRNVPNLYTQIIEESDSLLLSREQVDSLRVGSARWIARSNTLWLELGEKLAAMSDDYDVKLATQMTEDATDAAWELARREAIGIKEILSPLQMSMAPGTVQYLATSTGKILMRMYMY
ncbi:MAG: carboxypeptidase-like regulatory domain-containing protein [bacterium]